jgi:hypothetical protein
VPAASRRERPHQPPADSSPARAASR